MLTQQQKQTIKEELQKDITTLEEKKDTLTFKERRKLKQRMKENIEQLKAA